MEDLRSRWASNIKAAREKLGATQVEVGEAVGVTQQSVADWESGATTPTLERQIRLAQFLQVDDPRDLFPLEMAS